MVLGLTPAAFMFFTMTSYFIYDKFQVLESQLIRKGELLVQQLAPASEYAVFIKSPTLLEEIVTPILKEQDIIFIDFYDRDKELLLSRRNLQYIDEPIDDSVLRFSSEIQLQDVPLDNADFSLSLDEAQEDNSIIGEVRIGLTKKRLIAEQTEALIGGLVLSLASFGFAALLALFISKSILTPIKALSETLRLFKTGMLSARVKQRSSGEIGVLEANLNEMAQSLELAKRKELEHAMALEQARSDAENASKAKSQFLSIMSTELRNPLNRSLGCIQLLEQKIDEVNQKNLISQSILSSNQLVTLLDNILEYAKLENDEYIIHSTEFTLNRTFNRVIRQFSPVCSKQHVAIDFCCEALFQDINIVADESVLQKIIYNLIDTGLTRTQDGFIEIKVNGKPIENGEKLFASIEMLDNGIGFTPEELGSIFHSFGQSGSAEAAYSPNVGLNMAIVKLLVEKLDGKIEVSSSPEQGTCYSLEFSFSVSKFDKQKNDRLQKANQLSEQDLQFVSTLDGKILLIESNTVDQLVIKEMLNSVGAVVDIASNANIALEKIRRSFYELLIIDSQLPDMSLLDITQRLRAFQRTRSENTPILVLSGDVELKGLEILRQSGVTTILNKPIDMQKLRLTCSELMKPANSES